jgi:hypothetical protein
MPFFIIIGRARLFSTLNIEYEVFVPDPDECS